ncbi:MAG TPA: ATP-binding protein [Mucilaginibacter sp.]|nr:ATP-binding protein [Mucilaginibacter sp.]
MADAEIKELVIIITLIFLAAPAFILTYIAVYNRRKKRHIEEKELMRLTFEAEIVKSQLEVQEQTMQTIGADLHDNIGQLLSLTSLTLNSIELSNEAMARQKIDTVIGLTLRSIKEMRLLGKLLQGDQLISMGLPDAIRHEINWIEKSGQYKIEYENDGEMPAVSNPDKDLILFRILQEILNNIIKHAKASAIIIRLNYRDAIAELEVTDNGIGFTPDGAADKPAGMGLQNIQKRAAIIGGEAAIASRPGKGTIIIITTPYP